jgi:hypothetical protein
VFVLFFATVAPGDRNEKEIAMNVRTSMVAAGMTLALLAPIVTGAASADPWFRDGTHTVTTTPYRHGQAVIQKAKSKKNTKTAQSSKGTSTCSFQKTPQLCRDAV